MCSKKGLRGLKEEWNGERVKRQRETDYNNCLKYAVITDLISAPFRKPKHLK